MRFNDPKSRLVKRHGILTFVRSGRNAKMDGTILKYAAIGTMGAVAITSAPAMIVGAAATTAITAVAASQVSRATKEYSAATGRDGEKDKEKAIGMMMKAKESGIEAAKSFKAGLDSTKK